MSGEPAMTGARPYASLSGSLLARKGAARPAMRPQIEPLDPVRGRIRLGDSPEPALAAAPVHGDPLEDLGWNDHGADPEPVPAESVTSQPVSQQSDAAPHPVSQPEVLRRIEALAAMLSAPAAAGAIPAPAPEHASESDVAPGLPAPRPSRRRGAALAAGRKAAFTLRLDADRHLRLRLASTVTDRSAQALLTDALDHLLDSLPGLEPLARQVRPIPPASA